MCCKKKSRLSATNVDEQQRGSPNVVKGRWRRNTRDLDPQKGFAEMTEMKQMNRTGPTNKTKAQNTQK